MESRQSTDARPQPGLFATLLDRSFDRLVTLSVLRMLYTLAIICVTGVNLIVFLFGWSLAAGHFWPTAGWIIVVGTPPLWLAELIVVRVAIEYLIVQHKTSADLAIVRDDLAALRAAAEERAFRRGGCQLQARDETESAP